MFIDFPNKNQVYYSVKCQEQQSNLFRKQLKTAPDKNHSLFQTTLSINIEKAAQSIVNP